MSHSKILTTQYAENALAGKIVTSRKVQLAGRRHLEDLERSQKKDFPYRFDEEKGLRPIKFMEKFCKPSQGIFTRMDLQPWDHFWIGSLYGWVEKETGLRRFREGLIYTARKNGKTVKVSGLSLYGASKDGENGARVYQLANAMKQSRLTFDEAKAMVNASPKLRKYFRALRDALYYDPTNSKIEPQAADSERLDGLNCSLGIFDEIHEYKHYKLINVIKNSTASRMQPLILYITTAGYQLDGPLMDYYEKGSDVLEGVIQDDRAFYFFAELDADDDIEDAATWIKANPNMGVSVSLEDMIEEWARRKHIPAERNDFITKRLNLFVQSDEQSFVDWETIQRNSDSIDMGTLVGRLGVGGYDLSNTEDFSSACIEFPLDDGRVFVLSHSWVPQAKVDINQENLPFLEWQKEGWLTICRGPYVTKEDIYEWFVEQAETYAVAIIGYDPAQAFRLTQDLKLYGGEEWLKVVRQGALTLSPALKDIKELLLDGKVVFNQNKLFRWYLNNVRLVDDRNGNWLPTRQGRYRKIDGFSAWLNAHTETMKLMVDKERHGGDVGFVSIDELLGR